MATQTEIVDQEEIKDKLIKFQDILSGEATLNRDGLTPSFNQL